MKFYFILFAFASLFINLSNAQKFGTLDETEKKEFETLALTKIADLDFYFERISKSSSDLSKNNLIENLLRDFNPSAKVEVAGRNGITPYPIKKYLYSIVGRYSEKYSLVNIEFISSEVDKIKPHPTIPNSYIIEFSFTQRFCAKKRTNLSSNTDGMPTASYDYCDITTKSGSFILQKKNTILGSKWVLLYDDINVDDITILDVNE